MPFKSKAQQRFMFSQHPKIAEEFAKETPSFSKLPEKMAEGGEVQEGDDMPDWKKALEQIHQKYMQSTEDQGLGTLQGLKNVLQGNTTNQMPVPPMPATNMASGGDVVSSALQQILSPLSSLGQATQNTANMTGQALGNAFSPMMAPGLAQKAGDLSVGLDNGNPDNDNTVNPPMDEGADTSAPMTPPPTAPTPPSNPPISSMLQTAQASPPTDYNFYKNMTAEDRAKLAQQIMHQQHSGGNLVASGLGGLADAISNSYGKQHTNFQNQIEQGAEEAGKTQLSNIDTQRTQKLQDMQANTEMQKNDPKSPLSQSARQLMKTAGMNVPSGLPFNVIEKLAPEIANLALKQEMAGINANMKNQELGLKKQQMQESKDKNASEHWIQNLVGILPGQSVDHPSGYSIQRIK